MIRAFLHVVSCVYVSLMRIRTTVSLDAIHA